GAVLGSHSAHMGAGKAIAVLTSGGDAQGKECPVPQNPPRGIALGVKQAKMGLACS
uniref:Uncharacterized protein n=1 Tax=Meleagris gallopavo TaxID=9103 RepID=A0A803XM12_MELGA